MPALRIPAPGAAPDAKADARRVFDVLQAGGVALVPTGVGYGLLAASAEAVQRAFAAKRRRPGHGQGVIGTLALHAALHHAALPPATRDMVRVLHKDLGLSFGVIAPVNADDPRLAALTPATRANCIQDGTLFMYLGGGPLLAELGALNDAAGQLVLGSSANLTGTGQKFRLEDVDAEIHDAADVIVDYGLQRDHVYGGRASTIIDFAALRVVRVGAAYEVIRDALQRYWGVVLPPDPVYGADKEAADEPEP